MFRNHPRYVGGILNGRGFERADWTGREWAKEDSHLYSRRVRALDGNLANGTFGIYFIGELKITPQRIVELPFRNNELNSEEEFINLRTTVLERVRNASDDELIAIQITTDIPPAIVRQPFHKTSSEVDILDFLNFARTLTFDEAHSDDMSFS